MPCSAEFGGLFLSSERAKWQEDKTKKVNKAIRMAMFDARPKVQELLSSHLQAKLKIRKSSFAKTYKPYIQYSDALRPPVLVFTPKAGWLSAHETGAEINGGGKGVLIPINTRKTKLGNGRIGYKAFKRIIQELASQGNLNFVKVRGKVLVYAETAAAKEGGRDRLRRYGKRVSADRYNRKASAEIPIAVLVPKVTLRRRLQIKELSDSKLVPLVRGLIQKQLDELA